jgi:hypothetical protein
MPAKVDALRPSRLIDGTRAEMVRVRADTRDGLPVVRLDLLTPIASHSDALTVVGQPVRIPLERISSLIEALDRARCEAAGIEAPPQEGPQPRGRLVLAAEGRRRGPEGEF